MRTPSKVTTTVRFHIPLTHPSLGSQTLNSGNLRPSGSANHSTPRHLTTSGSAPPQAFRNRAAGLLGILQSQTTICHPWSRIS